MRLKLSGDINIESVYTAEAGPSAVQSIEKTTPEKIGTMLRNGVLCGNFGYAMEEMLLGGRLRHRHVQNMELFQVMKLNEWYVNVFALCQLIPVFLQAETLILVVNEPSKPTEKWLSDAYVQKMNRLLNEG
jgi:ABC-type maltose transport system permease subunit